MFSTPHLDSHSTTDPKPEILSAVQTGNRISRDGRNVRGIMHVRMLKKDDICWQRRLNHCFDNLKSSSIEPVCGIFEFKFENF